MDRGLPDILAQPAHWRQSEGNLIPVLDLQEASLQQKGEREASSLLLLLRHQGTLPMRLAGPASASLGFQLFRYSPTVLQP